MAAFFESGETLKPDQVFELTVAPLSRENRALLRAYIEHINDNTQYLAEHHQFDDKDVVVVITLPWSTVMLMAAESGFFSKA